MAVEPEASASAGDELLWHRWRAEGDEASREALARLYMPYARALAARSYSRRVHNEFEFDEYFHFALVGMLEALGRFAPERGVLFKTFSTPRIQGAILNGLERLSERQHQVAFRQRLARDRAASLADEAGLGRGHHLLQQLGQVGVGLALGFMLEGTGMFVGADEAMPDNAYANLESRQLRQRLWTMVEALTPREAQVINLHYRQQQSFEQISDALQVTKGRVSQLHKQGIGRLQKLAAASRSFDVAL